MGGLVVGPGVGFGDMVGLVLSVGRGVGLGVIVGLLDSVGAGVIWRVTVK